MNSKEWRERQNKLPGRVDRSDFKKTNYYKEGKLIATDELNGQINIPDMKVFPVQETTFFIDKAFLDSFTNIKEELFDEEAFKAARVAAVVQRVSFMDEFKQTLFEYHGISNHPKKELFFNILLSQTKDVGEMIGIAEEWVELLK
jgi:hypothetical protein